MSKVGTNIVRIELAGAREGQDFVFRGHRFIEGVLVMCCDDNRLAGILNSFRGRLPVKAPERLAPKDGLEAYSAYCDAAKVAIDQGAVHNLGRDPQQVDLNPLVESEPKVESVPEPEPEDDVVSDTDDLDAELDALMGDGVDSESVDSEASDVPAEVLRENAIRAALGQLDHDNKDHWTTTGLPKMEVLEELLGDESVSRSEVNAIAPDFKRAK